MRKEGEHAEALLVQYEFMPGLLNDKTEHESIDWHPSGLSKEPRKHIECECRFTKVGGNFNSTYYEFLRYPIDSILEGAKKTTGRSYRPL